MAVMIKDMEKPSQCYECYIVAMDYDRGTLYCKHFNKDIKEWEKITSRLPDCGCGARIKGGN